MLKNVPQRTHAVILKRDSEFNELILKLKDVDEEVIWEERNLQLAIVSVYDTTTVVRFSRASESDDEFVIPRYCPVRFVNLDVSFEALVTDPRTWTPLCMSATKKWDDHGKSAFPKAILVFNFAARRTPRFTA